MTRALPDAAPGLLYRRPGMVRLAATAAARQARRTPGSGPEGTPATIKDATARADDLAGSSGVESTAAGRRTDG